MSRISHTSTPALHFSGLRLHVTPNECSVELVASDDLPRARADYLGKSSGPITASTEEALRNYHLEASEVRLNGKFLGTSSVVGRLSRRMTKGDIVPRDQLRRILKLALAEDLYTWEDLLCLTEPAKPAPASIKGLFKQLMDQLSQILKMVLTEKLCTWKDLCACFTEPAKSSPLSTKGSFETLKDVCIFQTLAKGRYNDFRGVDSSARIQSFKLKKRGNLW